MLSELFWRVVRQGVVKCWQILWVQFLPNYRSPLPSSISISQGLNVELCPSLFEENLDIEQFPSFAAFVEETALHKVLEVSDRLDAEECGDRQRPDIIIGADTMVTLDGQMYGKPKTKENAVKTLHK